MARTTTWRRRVLAGATLVALTIGLASCARDNPGPGPSQTSAGTSSLGEAPPPTTKPAATPTATAGGGGPTAPFYPKDAKTYSLEFLKARARPDYTRLNQLGVLAAVAQVRDSITYTGNVNSQWTYISCGAGELAGQTNCVFDNAHGDETVIALANDHLGSPAAVLSANLDRTTYPNTPVAYIGELLDALGHGNLLRVVRLSNSTVKSELDCALEGGRVPGPMTVLDGTYSSVQIDGAGTDLGRSYTFKILTNPDGKAGAVKDILNKAC